jgi:hypothetical protein
VRVVALESELSLLSYCGGFCISKKWIALKLKMLTDTKIRFKKKQTFAIFPVVFAPGTQTCATELKKNGLLGPHAS